MLNPLWERPGLEGVERHGGAFWMRAERPLGRVDRSVSRNRRVPGALLALIRLSVAIDPHHGAARAQALSTAPAAVVVEHLDKTFRLPHRRYSTLKERALHPFRSSTFDELRAVDDVSFDDRARRVLRHRRPQRLRQEHAAEVPRRDLRDRRRRARRRRPAVAVHRARRRLQPRPDRARQRDDQRDHARPLARARRARASTRSSRSPSSRSSSTCSSRTTRPA